MMPKLWTFQVRGGEPFRIQPPGNPSQEHNGMLSVFHLVLTREQAEGLSNHLELTSGCKVTAWPMDEETDDQAAERETLLGHGREDAVYPSAACPPCFWFDPLVDGFCGWVSWPEETRNQALESHEAARDCIGNCPVH